MIGRRKTVLIFGVISLFVAMLAAPAAAGQADRPMIGSWEATGFGETQLRLQIGGGGQFHWQKQATNTPCGGFLVIRGQGEFNVTNDVLHVASAEMWCHGREGEGRQLLLTIPIDAIYDGDHIDVTGDLFSPTGSS